nr:hypothetical protein Itr_chr15CG01850 [Ipomoea trifida]
MKIIKLFIHAHQNPRSNQLKFLQNPIPKFPNNKVSLTDSKILNTQLLIISKKSKTSEKSEKDFNFLAIQHSDKQTEVK